MKPSGLKKHAVPAACVALVLGMTALAFAAPPLYDLFCKVTGYGGTTRVADKAPSKVLDRTVEVRFDANVSPALPLEFGADRRTMEVKIGETNLAFFKLTNPTDKPVYANATYNVTPYKTGMYFQKLECFCFQEKVIAPGETLELPVVFYVDPELAANPDTEEVTQITLSYTYFPMEKPAAQAPASGPRKS